MIDWIPPKNGERFLGRILIFKSVLILSLLLSLPSFAGDDVKIKILAINPSDSDKLVTSVTHFLPPEVTPDDIVDKSGMEVLYSKEKQTYFLTQSVELAPKETKTIVIVVRNVWVVSPDAIGQVREQLDKSVVALQGTKYEESGKLLYDKVSERIAGIESEQVKAIGIMQRIQMYRANMKQLEDIQSEIASVSALRRLKEEEANGIRTVKFMFSASNPNPEAKDMSIRAELPKDIMVKDIIDKGDFNLLYDDDRRRFLVQKVEPFQANEQKTFTIVLRDIWFIPPEEIDFLKKQLDRLMEHFKGSDYEDYGIQSQKYITELLDSVKNLQDEVGSSTSIEDRIRAFILNSERFNLAKKKVKELQDLLLEIPMKKDLDEFEQIRQAVKELSRVIDVLRLGFTPDLSTTWWIILGIVAFLFILTATFYVTWLVNLQASKWGKKKVAKKAPTEVKAEQPPKPEEAKAKAA